MASWLDGTIWQRWCQFRVFQCMNFFLHCIVNFEPQHILFFIATEVQEMLLFVFISHHHTAFSTKMFWHHIWCNHMSHQIKVFWQWLQFFVIAKKGGTFHAQEHRMFSFLKGGLGGSIHNRTLVGISFVLMSTQAACVIFFLCNTPGLLFSIGTFSASCVCGHHVKCCKKFYSFLFFLCARCSLFISTVLFSGSWSSTSMFDFSGLSCSSIAHSISSIWAAEHQMPSKFQATCFWWWSFSSFLVFFVSFFILVCICFDWLLFCIHNNLVFSNLGFAPSHGFAFNHSTDHGSIGNLVSFAFPLESSPWWHMCVTDGFLSVCFPIAIHNKLFVFVSLSEWIMPFSFQLIVSDSDMGFAKWTFFVLSLEPSSLTSLVSATFCLFSLPVKELCSLCFPGFNWLHQRMTSFSCHWSLPLCSSGSNFVQGPCTTLKGFFVKLLMHWPGSPPFANFIPVNMLLILMAPVPVLSVLSHLFSNASQETCPALLSVNLCTTWCGVPLWVALWFVRTLSDH